MARVSSIAVRAIRNSDLLSQADMSFLIFNKQNTWIVSFVRQVKSHPFIRSHHGLLRHPSNWKNT